MSAKCLGLGAWRWALLLEDPGWAVRLATARMPTGDGCAVKRGRSRLGIGAAGRPIG